MLCISACPTDCFEIQGLDFYSSIGRLKKILSSVSFPVLGCAASGSNSCHVKTSCLGFLSEEHLLAFYVFIDATLQIDLTGCQDCRNGFIVDVLKKRIKSIETKTSIIISNRIKLVNNKSDLKFQDMAYDRRGFFKAIKNMTFRHAAELFDNDDPGEEPQSYSSKKLPLKRDLLNRTIKILPEKECKTLLERYYYIVYVTEDCNNCFACIGMCPTGALKIESTRDRRDLFFSSSLCNGCGLCESFCINKSVRIEKRFSYKNPFIFSNTKRELICSG
jgi:ferredoxin